MRLKHETAERRVKGFHRRFGDAHLSLACHAAFPVALNPDLLYRIWANFSRDCAGRLLEIPWVAVADLLLSNLCEAVGPELFEMDDQIRTSLLGRLNSDANLGARRIKDLAEFLLDYVRRHLESDDPDLRDFAKAQRMTALAHTVPRRAAREFAQEMRMTDPEANAAETLRIASLIEANAPLLSDYSPLLAYAKGIIHYVHGDVQAATSLFESMMDEASRIVVEGVGLNVPDVILRRTGRSETTAPGASSKSRTLYVLAVGIDEYAPPVPTLRGSVNDIDSFEGYLLDRVAYFDEMKSRIVTLRNSDATLDAVTGSFRVHLGRAGLGDIALFYFSGHGSREKAPEELWTSAPSRLISTLVCYDSRLPHRWDLSFLELSRLVAEVSARGAQVVLILDSAHSGSALPNPSGSDRQSAAPPTVDYVLMASCRDDDKENQETQAAGRPRGAFSYYLEETLQNSITPLSYRELFARTSARVRSRISHQTPQLIAPNASSLDRLFLEGVMSTVAAPGMTVVFQRGEWLLQAGHVNSLPLSHGTENIELALYPFDASPDTLLDLSKAVGKARVVEVGPVVSKLEISGVGDLSHDMTFKAVIASSTSMIAVRIQGESAEGVRLAKDAIASAGPSGERSLYVREAMTREPSDYRLLAQGGQYVIAGSGSDRPLIGETDGFTEETAREVVRRLEHMGRWTLTARLANPASSIQPDEVEFEILQDDAALKGHDVRLMYRETDGESIPPRFRIRVSNRGARVLYVAILILTQDFKISAELQSAGSIRLGSDEVYWPKEGRDIIAAIPDSLWAEGVEEYKEILKLIVCTDEFDARLLEQPALEAPRLAGRLHAR